MFTFKGATKILLALILVAFATTGAKADILVNDGIKGAAYGYTGGINDSDVHGDGITLLGVFNNYFGGSAYSSSNELFQELGLHDGTRPINYSWEALEGAMFIGVSKSSGLAYELTLAMTDAMTDTVISIDRLGLVDSTTPFDQYTTGLAKGELEPTLYLYQWGEEIGYVEPNYVHYNPGGKGNRDDYVHMIVLDVTALMKLMPGYEDISEAYMFCWEDLTVSSSNPTVRYPADWDFQDLVYIMVNVTKTPSVVTPEPATALVLLVGLFACPLTRKLRRK